MSEKVRLSREVCTVLETIQPFIPDSRIVANTADKSWTDEYLLILNTQDSDMIMRALVLGYEPKEDAE